MSHHQEEPLGTEAVEAEDVDPADVADRLDEDSEEQRNLPDRDPEAEQEFRSTGPEALPSTPREPPAPRP